jgi:hypothetical protein
MKNQYAINSMAELDIRPVSDLPWWWDDLGFSERFGPPPLRALIVGLV